MSIAVLSEAAALAAALLDAATLIEQAGAAGLAVTCYSGEATIVVCASAGSAQQRAALVSALGGLAGTAGCRQHDSPQPSASLAAAGLAGGTVIEIRTPLAVRAVPGGTLAAGPGGQHAVIPAGQQPPPGWRWVTDLDDETGDEPGQRQEVA